MAGLERPFALTLHCDALGTMEFEAVDINGSVPLGVVEPADLVWGIPQRGEKRRWMNEQRVQWRWNGQAGAGNMERSTPSALEEFCDPSGRRGLREALR